jgi:hypothetical protein
MIYLHWDVVGFVFFCPLYFRGHVDLLVNEDFFLHVKMHLLPYVLGFWKKL